MTFGDMRGFRPVLRTYAASVIAASPNQHTDCCDHENGYGQAGDDALQMHTSLPVTRATRGSSKHDVVSQLSDLRVVRRYLDDGGQRDGVTGTWSACQRCSRYLSGDDGV